MATQSRQAFKQSIRRFLAQLLQTMNLQSKPRHPFSGNANRPGGCEVKPERVVSASCRFRACARSLPQATNGREARLLLLLGPREASLYRMEVTGGIPEQLLLMSTRTRACSSSDYELIAQALRTPGRILISARPGRAASGLRHFIHWLARMHPRLSKRIAGLLPLANAVLSPAQLLAKAREFYVRSGNSPGGTSGFFS